jgi:hypothetical protein
VVHVEEHGRWGSLECPAGTPRQLALWQMTQGPFIRSATTNDSTWLRYSEASRFPLWAWSCTPGSVTLGSAGPVAWQRPASLEVELGDLKKGTLDTEGSFVASRGRPCIIDSRTGEFRFVANHQTWREADANKLKDDVRKLGLRACDPLRSAHCSGAEDCALDAPAIARVTP